MKYVDRVEYNLKGLTAVSTGVSPGCEECASRFGFTDDDEDDELIAEPKTAVQKLDEAYESGGVCDEGSFSWSSCGICDSRLGGNRSVWHALIEVDENQPDAYEERARHFDDACDDCVMYLANGDVPAEENEERE